MINCIFSTSIFPDSLKTTRVIPIPKPKKDRNDILSYRPINNMNTVEKIVVEAIKIQLHKFMKNNNLLDNNMHGSRPNHSIITAKVDIDEEIGKHKDKGNKIAALNTDLSAAYDTTDHKLLLSKLEHLGIKGLAYELFEIYLKDRKIYTEV